MQTLLAKNPFLTDENLAEQFDVSIQTIRLDRLALGIPELRERTRYMAENAQKKLQSITSDDIVGELIDLEIGVSGISMMTVTKEMVLQKTGVARGQYMFAQANSLALAVIDAPAAVTGVANVKYKIPVYSGSVLVARAEVKRKQEDKYTIWVKIRNNRKEVFRAKFLITALPEERNQENENRG
ncbi:MAG: transcription factor FapR [Acidaminococcus sp.]|nr:transcription factor FapR [Acidaminococcus sp.]